MTRKDYIALAAELHIDYRSVDYPMGYDLKAGFMLAVSTICDALQCDNICFDRQIFIDAVINGSKAAQQKEV